MFETAIAAGVTTALTWAPDHPDPAGGRECCPLCFRRYRVMVLDGPLRGLPHAVAHAVVETVDEVIAVTVNAHPALLGARDSGRTSIRRAAASGGLLVVALEELGAADARLSELRRRVTEPAVEHYLAAHGVDDVPQAWS
jgi:hypothetical protein